MAVYKRGGVWWYGFLFNGERIQESTKQGNKRVAEQMEAARRTERAKGLVGIQDKPIAPTLREFEKRFVETLQVESGQKAASWYGSILKVVLNYEPLASARLDSITKELIDGYTQVRRKAYTKHKHVKRLLQPASINRELATIRRLLNMASELGVIDKVPKVQLLPGERVREFTLTRKAEAIYLAASPAPLADVAAFLLDTGLRLGEALSLDWSQVRLHPPQGSERGYITVLGEKSKSGRTRHVPLTARAESILRKLEPSDDGHVFHHGDGRRLLESSLAHTHKRIRALLKMPAGFVLHSLRHTFGTRLGESGTADAFAIMRLMGHASITTSQRYCHPTPETLERAVRRMEESGLNVPAVTTVFTTLTHMPTNVNS
jgi:integrase